jgi:hypothetical protein
MRRKCVYSEYQIPVSLPRTGVDYSCLYPDGLRRVYETHGGVKAGNGVAIGGKDKGLHLACHEGVQGE